MTYSWALIMMLIVILAISYFGVIKPKQLLPNRCLFSPEIECLAYALSSVDNTFRIKLKNNFGDMITVTSLNLNSDTPTTLACTNPSNPSNLAHGDSIDLAFTACNLQDVGILSGETAKLFLNMSFYPLKGGSTYANTVQVK